MIDRQEWLEARKKGIGGSDAAAIIGVSRYRTAVDVWEDKLGLVPERPQTAAMAWGLRLEDAIATAYTEETGRPLRRVGGIRRAKHVRDFPMIGSIDRLAKDRVVELKKKRTADDLFDDGPPAKRVPADWYVQTQHYLEVVDLDVADVAVLIGGTEFRIIEIPRDRAFGADLRVEEADFWHRYVEAGVSPPLVGADAEKLPRLFPSGSGEKVATPEVDEVVERLLAVRAREDQAAKERAELEVRLKEYLGKASDLVSSVAKVTWRNGERTEVAWKAIAAAYRTILETLAANPTAYVGEALPAILAANIGTDDLAAFEGVHSETKSVRTFRLDRKERKG